MATEIDIQLHLISPGFLARAGLIHWTHLQGKQKHHAGVLAGSSLAGAQNLAPQTSPRNGAMGVQDHISPAHAMYTPFSMASRRPREHAIHSFIAFDVFVVHGPWLYKDDDRGIEHRAARATGGR